MGGGIMVRMCCCCNEAAKAALRPARTWRPSRPGTTSRPCWPSSSISLQPLLRLPLLVLEHGQPLQLTLEERSANFKNNKNNSTTSNNINANNNDDNNNATTDNKNNNSEQQHPNVADSPLWFSGRERSEDSEDIGWVCNIGGRKMKICFLPIGLLLIGLGSGSGVPMVENSVKFALDRCKQFLKLAIFLRESALEENSDIRKTKRICDYLVKIDRDFNEEDEDDRVDEDEDNVVVAKAQHFKASEKTKKTRSKSINVIQSIEPGVSLDNPRFSQCEVKLFPRQEFKGKAVTRSKSVNDTFSMKIKSLRVIGPCTWTFYDQANFTGHFFTIWGHDEAIKKAVPSLNKHFNHSGTRASEPKSMKRSHSNKRRDSEF
eukprot:maker-scaffold406_size180810-snap-gene-0.24 protein:Tk06959 transcript:maker-scaffold406_size180810-snap-gene-0.24-mRNA-1 annotation:"---NA---"